MHHQRLRVEVRESPLHALDGRLDNEQRQLAVPLSLDHRCHAEHASAALWDHVAGLPVAAGERDRAERLTVGADEREVEQRQLIRVGAGLCRLVNNIETLLARVSVTRRDFVDHADDAFGWIDQAFARHSLSKGRVGRLDPVSEMGSNRVCDGLRKTWGDRRERVSADVPKMV